jgi:hypothetical protein
LAQADRVEEATMRIPREVQERFARICELADNSYRTLFKCRNELFNLLQQVRGELIECALHSVANPSHAERIVDRTIHDACDLRNLLRLPDNLWNYLYLLLYCNINDYRRRGNPQRQSLRDMLLHYSQVFATLDPQQWSELYQTIQDCLPNCENGSFQSQVIYLWASGIPPSILCIDGFSFANCLLDTLRSLNDCPRFIECLRRLNIIDDILD